MTSRLLIFSLLLLTALFFAACGGGGAGNEDARLVGQYGLSLDVIEGGGAQYALTVQEAETVLVDVCVENATNLTRSYVELNYDAELITPLRVMEGGFLGADTLFLGVTDRARRVPVAVARTGENPEGVSGRGIIARIEFARGGSPSRDVASCPGSPEFTGFDVDQDADTITVHWTDNNGGDTNKDRVLNGLDIFPIAANFGKPVDATNACADSNGDGSINGQDVFPIAVKFDRRFDAYNVYWDVTPGMEEAFVPENGSPIPVDYAGACHGEYQYTVGPLLDDNEYYIGVTVLDDVADEEGAFCVSQPQVLGSPNYFKPAVGLWGENYGDYIHVDWDAPQTSERVLGYHVYRKPESGGSYEDISGKTSSTQYDDHSVADLDTDNYLYHVVVEYESVMSDPTSDISVHWEKTNAEPWINAVTTSRITLDDAVSTATLHVDGDDGEGGDNITWTWTVEAGHGTFPGGSTGETVTFDCTASSSEKVTVRVTGDDGTVPCTETIRLVFTDMPVVKVGTNGPADGMFIDETLENLSVAGTTNFANDVFVRKSVVLMNFWASW